MYCNETCNRKTHRQLDTSKVTVRKKGIWMDLQCGPCVMESGAIYSKINREVAIELTRVLSFGADEKR
ncbi:hypothetical protein KP509_01G003800 [Ceratopteris richardii]|uniref:Uncharacterized protein n=1 Tax=Ceratopteris richardii TaxID=49495 RepID=A0A8T2VE33_CERRI|nr:hypothetical protein KP509_01G003800 [Ceratopteris richardii]